MQAQGRPEVMARRFTKESAAQFRCLVLAQAGIPVGPDSWPLGVSRGLTRKWSIRPHLTVENIT